MVKVITKESLTVEHDRWMFAPGFDLKKHLKTENLPPGIAAEFLGTGDVAAAFFQRQRYEVDAGRDLEPILYTEIFSEVVDSTLPELVPVNVLGPGGVVFEEVQEGGSVKFATIGESSYSIPIKQYGVGLEYTKKMAVFNQVWTLAPLERRVGIAHNALLNHVHLYPILSYTYAAANQTAASTDGSTLAEKYLRTIEDAIINSQNDTDNPRNGPYVLLGATANQFLIERALNVVPQQGVTLQSSAINAIRSVVIYNGATLTRGKLSTAYSGVTAGKAYLINMAFRDEDFQSWVKQPLQSESGNPDLARFIRERTVWDSLFGMYANPLRAVEEITWPTS